MRVEHLLVREWRNLQNVGFDVPHEATLVCLVGENGTGKSNVLELLSAIAHSVGISPGVQISRGNPLGEIHSVEAVVSLTDDPTKFLPGNLFEGFVAAGHHWDGRIAFESHRPAGGDHTIRISAFGAAEGKEQELAQQIINVSRVREDTHHLYVDADRSYPPLDIHPQSYAEALNREWQSAQWTRDRAFLPTRFLYDDWIQYFLARETQQAIRQIKAVRASRDAGTNDPAFVDEFVEFKETLQRILPHLKFEGVDERKRTILFDAAGVPLRFTQLSGGEREIAFLVGQIERFKLRQGLLLVDEPDLHLNPDLIRTWIAFLRDTIEEGQVWIATHSMEAVEVTGTRSTFVLERDHSSRIVRTATPLENRPVLQVLSAALGVPAFSISNLRFVFIEGERNVNERERFQKLVGEPQTSRFMEAGNCTEVARKLAAVSQLAVETEQQLHFGGVIDRDFRTHEQLKATQEISPVFLLPCHEIENLFLHPPTLGYVLKRLGRSADEAQESMQSAADNDAGAWIQQRAYVAYASKIAPTGEVRKLAWDHDWTKVSADPSTFVSEVLAKQALTNPDEQNILESALTKALEEYQNLRVADDLWKKCMGKQVLSHLAKQLGFSAADFLEKTVVQLWHMGEASLPEEVGKLRAYIKNL